MFFGNITTSYVKKICACVLILLFILAPINHTFQQNSAEAVTTFEVGSIPTWAQTAVTWVGVGYDFITSNLANALAVKDLTLDGIGWMLAKAAVSSIMRSTINWVNSGFQGSPAFVTDLEGLLQQTVDGVISDFIEGSALSALCSPFALNIKASLDLSYYGGGRRGAPVARCTIADIQRNLSTFGKSVDNAADWSTWMEVAANKHNNPYGAMVEAEAALDVSIVNAKGEQVNLLKFGSGFLSQKKCVEGEKGADGMGPGKPVCTIVTPGQTISASLNKSLGLGADSLVAADEINELIGALIGQVMQGVMGASGLAGYTPPAAGAEGRPIGQAGGMPTIDLVPTIKNLDEMTEKQKQALAIFSSIENEIISACSRGPILFNATTSIYYYKKTIHDDNGTERIVDVPLNSTISSHYKNSLDKQMELNIVIEELRATLVRARRPLTPDEAMAIVNEYSRYTSDSRVYITLYDLDNHKAAVSSDVNSICRNNNNN